MNLLSLKLGFIEFFGGNGSEFITIYNKAGEGTNLITTYSLCVVIGLVLAILLAFKEAKRLGISKAHIKSALFIGVPIIVVASRLVYVAFNWSVVSDELLGGHIFTAILDIQDGGMSIFGGLIAAAILVYIFAKKNKINVFKILDVAAPALLLTQIFSRLGNIFSLTLIGKATTPEFLATFLPTWLAERYTFDTVAYHPFFLYEGLWLTLGLVIILLLRRMKTKLTVGSFIGIYLIWYGFGNAFIVELFRQGTTVNLNLIASILICLSGIAYLVIKQLKSDEQTYFNTINELHEKSIHCVVFDLDQTLIKSDKLVNAGYGEILSKAHGLTVYDDPQLALDSERLRRYVQFSKENYTLLTEPYRGLDYTLKEMQALGKEIIVISKLPAELIALKLHHYEIAKYVDRFINSNEVAKLGKQYNPFGIMIFSIDRKILNFASRC